MNRPPGNSPDESTVGVASDPPGPSIDARKPKLLALKCWLTVFYLYPALDLTIPFFYIPIVEHSFPPPRFFVHGLCGLLLVASVLATWTETRRWSLFALLSGLLALVAESAVPLASLVLGSFMALLLHSRVPGKSAGT